MAVDGLRPGTAYTYRVAVDGTETGKEHAFRTAPERGKAARFTVIFGGGAGYTPWNERMWDVMAGRRAIAFMALGDNVYIDTPTVRATQQYCYYRRQSRPEYRRFTAAVPSYAIWDDHEFGTNDCQGGPKIDEPAWKIPVWETFRNNWNNPAYGGGRRQPGCWFTWSIGDVDFFFIDGRYYRDRKGGTMLGPVQKKWLLAALKNSRGTFKILCSNVPISANVKPGSKDTWDGFPGEREEIFSFIAKNRIEGFFVITADRHRSDARVTRRKNAYDIYEFESSKLTNVHTHGLIDKNPNYLFGHNRTCSFGLLTFDTTAADPTVTYDIVTIDNEVAGSLTLKKSRLSFK